jgi:hypothetical protein
LQEYRHLTSKNPFPQHLHSTKPSGDALINGQQVPITSPLSEIKI